MPRIALIVTGTRRAENQSIKKYLHELHIVDLHIGVGAGYKQKYQAVVGSVSPADGR